VKNGKRHFSVSYSVKINGAAKRPAVCYELTDDVAAAVEKLAREGRARIYDEEVRFVSGRAVPVKRTPAPAPVVAAPVAAPISDAAPAVPAAVPDSAPETPAPDTLEPEAPTADSDPVDAPQSDSAESNGGSDEGSEPERKSSRRTK
jgi:hypothetical protein